MKLFVLRIRVKIITLFFVGKKKGGGEGGEGKKRGQGRVAEQGMDPKLYCMFISSIYLVTFGSIGSILKKRKKKY